MALTRQDFELIAVNLRELDKDMKTVKDLAQLRIRYEQWLHDLCFSFQNANDRFDRKRFLDAVGNWRT